MKTDEEKYLVASNGDHAHACITVGGGIRWVLLRQGLALDTSCCGKTQAAEQR